MRFHAVLNRKGGSLRTIDLDAFGERMRKTLSEAGHDVDIQLVEGRGIVAALDKAARRRGVDVVMAGGGDGTISAAAASLMNRDKMLAVLPAGTMNLFARSLGIPLDLDQAVAAFATGRERAVDVATANGRPFVHQYSIGMHAKMVRLREKMEFGSRLGKIKASASAAYQTLRNPPRLNVLLTVDGETIQARTAGIGVSNNLFGEGHLPYTDTPDGGRLGVYVTIARRPSHFLGFAVGMARGQWQANPHVEVYEGRTVTLELANRRHAAHCVIDGELERSETRTTIEIHPESLKVLVPKAE